MASGYNETEEVDYDFFEDKNSDISESNNNALINFPAAAETDSKYNKNIENQSKINSLKNSDVNENEYLDSYESSSSASESMSGSKSSKSSRIISNRSIISLKQESYKSNNKNKSTESLSTKASSSLHKSGNESDVTSVSSLESENLSNILKPPKQPTKISKISAINSKYHTHFRSTDDVDMVSADVILQAMMRIHEERRLVQRLKPKWVDPNTKDYSVSGITKKLNLVPETIVSMTKKNLRSNPFFCQNSDIEKRLYHTAINRIKEKDRIEKENKEIVMRLQRIRPSPGITKEELLKDYSKVNRFSVQSTSKSRFASTATSCRPQSSANGSSCSKIRRTNSSTLISRFADSRQSEGKRIMSANSLTSNDSRPSNNSNLIKKRN